MIKIIYAPNYKPANTIYFCIHHSGGTTNVPLASSKYQTAEEVNQAHRVRWGMKSGLGYFGGYNFFIGYDGTITQFREIGSETMAQRGWNFDGVAVSVCLSGNFTKSQLTGNPIDYPSDAQIVSLRWLRNKFPQVRDMNIVPHRFLQPTECHGDGLSDDWGRKTCPLVQPVMITPPTPLISQKIAILQAILALYAKLVELQRRLRFGFQRVIVGGKLPDCGECDTMG